MPGKLERRRPGHFRICGACGKRNKARRAECSRCGEPLRGLPEALPGARYAPPPPPPQYRWLVAAVVLAAVAGGFAVYRTFGGGSDGLGTAQVLPSEAPPATDPTPAAAPTFDPTSAERFAQARGSVERGEKLLTRGDFRGAASLLADAARLVPEDARTANAYGRALLGLGSRDRALVQFERAARMDSGVVSYRLDFAKSLADAGRVREAAREYEAVGGLEPGNVAAAEGLQRLQPSSGASAGTSTGVDLGGASSSGATAPTGGTFTNEDLERGVQPARPAARPSPAPIPSRAAPPSPYSGPFASPSPG